MHTALIVIDAQESFRHRPYFSPRDVPGYLAAQNALIEAAQRRGIPIVRIFHVESDARSPFAIKSGYVRPLEGLAAFQEAAEFRKQRHSALVGSGLDVWLTENGIRTLIISGIRTEQCCETTTRHASDLGYRVRYVTDATLTFDMELADGSWLSAPEIKRRTAAVLDGRFATICTVEEAYETADPAVAH
jgi:nicotinamidase-related amidase